jgi:hypothetical protein
MLTYEQKKIFRNNWKLIVKDGFTKDRPELFVLYNYFMGKNIDNGFSKNTHSSKFWRIHSILIRYHYIMDDQVNHHYFPDYKIIIEKLFQNIHIKVKEHLQFKDEFINLFTNNKEFINIKNGR